MLIYRNRWPRLIRLKIQTVQDTPSLEGFKISVAHPGLTLENLAYDGNRILVEGVSQSHLLKTQVNRADMVLGTGVRPN